MSTTNNATLSSRIAPEVMLEMLFDRMPMGIAIVDCNFRIQRYNPTWHGYSQRYAPPDAAPLEPGVGYFDHLPGTEPTVLPLYQRVLAGETVRQEAVRLDLPTGVTYWDVTLAPLMEDGEVVGILNVTVDATERVHAQRHMEQRVEERTRELARRQDIAESLADILSVLNSTRTAQEIFTYITRRSCELLRADACLLYSTNGFTVTNEAHYNLPASLAVLRTGELYRSEQNITLLNRQPVAVSDAVAHLRSVLTQPHLTAFQRSWYQEVLASFRAYLGMPVVVDNQVYGGLVFYFRAGREFDEEDIQLAQILASHAALAIENARLRQQEERGRLEAERRRLVAESLRDVIGMINANVPLDELLRQAVELAAQRLGAAACVLHHFDLANEVITQVAGYGMEGVFAAGRSRPFSGLRPSGGEAYLKATLQRLPTYTNYPPLPERLDEIRRDPTIPEPIKAERIRLRERYAASFSVPLFIQDKVYGGMVFYYAEPQEFSDEQIQLGLTFAEQVALAIENARLRQDEQQRRRVAESLRDTLSKINTGGALDDVLNFITTQADELTDSRFVVLYVQQGEQGPLEVRSLRGQFPQAMSRIRLRPGEGTVGRAVEERRVMAIPDVDKIGYAASVQQIDDSRPVYVEQANFDLLRQVSDAFKAVLAIPLQTQNGVYGALAFYYPSPRQFRPEEIQLASAFADQAALAVENALLRGQAAEMAKLAERSRLARDLHDAVTQTLFSASLIADVLPRLWERNPDAGRQKLEELRMLTRGALSEMRTLLLELRPDTLADVELGDLYRHLANAFSGRTRVPVSFTQEGQAPLPPPVKEVFYRVAQEALNNIAKHAHASAVRLHLDAQPGRAELTIEDDGAGFDAAGATAENMGLKIMHERADSVGASLRIHSQPAAGTQIELLWCKT